METRRWGLEGVVPALEPVDWRLLAMVAAVISFSSFVLFCDVSCAPPPFSSLLFLALFLICFLDYFHLDLHCIAPLISTKCNSSTKLQWSR